MTTVVTGHHKMVNMNWLKMLLGIYPIRMNPYPMVNSSLVMGSIIPLRYNVMCPNCVERFKNLAQQKELKCKPFLLCGKTTTHKEELSL